MRIQHLAAATIVAVHPALAEQTWIVACQGGSDSQYTQTIGGEGHFSVANGNGTYTSIPLKQTFYNGSIVCGVSGAQSASQIAEVCADTDRNAIAVLSPTQVAKGVAPENATIYCSASVSVHQDKK
jgi:hypothetical protein